MTLARGVAGAILAATLEHQALQLLLTQHLALPLPGLLQLHSVQVHQPSIDIDHYKVVEAGQAIAVLLPLEPVRATPQLKAIPTIGATKPVAITAQPTLVVTGALKVALAATLEPSLHQAPQL